MKLASYEDTRNLVRRLWVENYLPIIFCFIFCTDCRATDNWPAFRGDGSGTAKADLRTQWSAAEGVAWQSDIPGYGENKWVNLNEVKPNTVQPEDCTENNLIKLFARGVFGTLFAHVR